MWTNYLKIALRNLRRHPAYAGINVFGLAVSMAVCLLLITFIWEQFQYDRFHAKKDRIVRMVTNEQERDRPEAAAPAPLAPALEQTAPEVEETVRLSNLRGNLVRQGRAISADGVFVDSSFFEIFSFDLARGNPQTALSEPKSLVLTRPMAQKLFGEENPIGQTVAVEDAFTTTAPYTVTGVLEEPAGPTHLQFDVLASFVTLETLPDERSRTESWARTTSFPTYVLLDEAADAGDLTNDLSRLVQTRYPEVEKKQEIQLSTQALTDITPGPYYGSPVEIRTVPWFVIYFLGGLGLVLLVTACFNYVGLSVARSLERATEVGVRKVVGARRRQVAAQFLTEAVLFALLALIVAYSLLPWMVSRFNNLSFIGRFDGTITSSIYHIELLIVFALFAVAAGLLAGALPAARFSALRPLRVIHEYKSLNLSGMGKLSLRKVLMVVQFAFAVIFIISAAQLYRQYDYMANATFGLRTDHIINVRLQNVRYQTFREELSQYPSVAGISAASSLPPEGGHMTELTYQGQTLRARQVQVGLRFIDNMGLEIVAGRGFSPTMGRDSVRSIIINKTAARALGFEGPAAAVGASLSMDTKIGGIGTKEVEIVGIVEDYPFGSFTEPIRPLVLWYGTGDFWLANVHVQSGQLAAARQAIETTWKKLDPVHPADYQLYETEIARRPMNQLFGSLARIVGFVAVLTIVIALLGLLGMAAYAARTRIKEIGIRKVLGASVGDVSLLLSKDFLVLVGVAAVLAVPAAWYINMLWLEQFARRIGFTGGVISGSLAAVLLIALLTVGSQTIKAALTNPADSLRYE